VIDSRDERRTHNLGRDGLGCLITLAATDKVYILKRQPGVRTPTQQIQLTEDQILEMAAVVRAAREARGE
jgi:hypothetical protein